MLVSLGFSCEAIGATAHDEVHNAFMTLPPYTRTSEGEVSFCALACSTWMLLSEVTPIPWILAILEAILLIGGSSYREVNFRG